MKKKLFWIFEGILFVVFLFFGIKAGSRYSANVASLIIAATVLLFFSIFLFLGPNYHDRLRSITKIFKIERSIKEIFKEVFVLLLCLVLVIAVIGFVAFLLSSEKLIIILIGVFLILVILYLLLMSV